VFWCQDSTMRWLLPRSRPGWWSVGLAIALPVLVAVGAALTNTLYAGVPSGNSFLGDLRARPVLWLTMVAGMGSGIAAFVVGLVAIIRAKDRGLLTIAATAFGALLIVFLFGEAILGG